MAYSQKEIIEKIKGLDFPAGSYVVVGGAVLATRGIRETNDLDIVVLPEFFEKLSASGWEADLEYQNKWGRSRLKKDGVEIYPDLFLENRNEFFDVEKLISDADLIDGIPLQKLDNLMVCKLDTAREKDLKDVALIKRYLEAGGL